MLQTKIQNGHVDLRFDAGADSVDAPSPGVVVVEVHPAEPDARVPLPCAVEEAVVDGDPDAAVLDVGAAAPDEHGLVVRGEVAPRDRHVRAAVGDVDEAVGEVAQGAAVDPDVPGPGLDLHRVGVVAAAARDLQAPARTRSRARTPGAPGPRRRASRAARGRRRSCRTTRARRPRRGGWCRTRRRRSTAARASGIPPGASPTRRLQS